MSAMQMLGSLALEDRSEGAEAVLGRCSISCACTSTFLLPTKEVDPQGKQVYFGERIRQFHLFVKRGFDSRIEQLLGIIPRYPFTVSQPNHSAPRQSWLHDGQRCVTSQVCSRGCDNWTHLRDLSPRPS